MESGCWNDNDGLYDWLRIERLGGDGFDDNFGVGVVWFMLRSR